jgi:hypothetical protein
VRYVFSDIGKEQNIQERIVFKAMAVKREIVRPPAAEIGDDDAETVHRFFSDAELLPLPRATKTYSL